MGKKLGVVETGNSLKDHLKRSGEKSKLFDCVEVVNFDSQGNLPANFTDYIIHLCDADRFPGTLDRLRVANPTCRIVGYSGNERLRERYSGVAEVYEPIPAYRLLEEGLHQRSQV